MENTFIEFMVKRDDKPIRIAKKVAMILGAFVVNGLALLFAAEFLSVTAVLTFFCFMFLWPMIEQEYEYIYTDGLLDFDVVYGKSRRHRLLSVDAKLFRFIVPYDNREQQATIAAKYDKTINATSGKFTERTYVGIVKKNDKVYKIFFDPDDRIVDALRHYIPNKFVKRI